MSTPAAGVCHRPHTPSGVSGFLGHGRRCHALAADRRCVTLELTHAWSAILPLVIAANSAYAVSALLLKRSVLTEKVARRGLHLLREYSVDPLETFFVLDVVRPSPQVRSSDAAVMVDNETLSAVAYVFADNHAVEARVVARDGSHQCVIHLSDLLTARRHDLTEEYGRERHLPSTRTVARRNTA
jgi:chloride channel protein, CIC family